jgi:hypothetical protein
MLSIKGDLAKTTVPEVSYKIGYLKRACIMG